LYFQAILHSKVTIHAHIASVSFLFYNHCHSRQAVCSFLWMDWISRGDKTRPTMSRSKRMFGFRTWQKCIWQSNNRRRLSAQANERTMGSRGVLVC